MLPGAEKAHTLGVEGPAMEGDWIVSGTEDEDDTYERLNVNKSKESHLTVTSVLSNLYKMCCSMKGKSNGYIQ